jgi:hypothetical protein
MNCAVDHRLVAHLLGRLPEVVLGHRALQPVRQFDREAVHLLLDHLEVLGDAHRALVEPARRAVVLPRGLIRLRVAALELLAGDRRLHEAIRDVGAVRLRPIGSVVIDSGSWMRWIRISE